MFNDTKVLKARFLGQKASGGRIEVLVERLTGATTALAQIRASKSPLPGTKLVLADAFEVTVGERVEPFYTLHFPADCLTLIEQYGRLPLPPYIEHDPDSFDETRYQTVYAANPGAVAAPTAGLHFDPALFAALDARGVERATLTLHVGAGTFQPVRVENLAEHKMHSEWYRLPQALADKIAATKARGNRVIAVGTTSMRALEAAARDADDAGRPLAETSAETDIFITPGYQFRVVDRLVTNFHLPKSTLMMLVSAFAGMDAIRAAYRACDRGAVSIFQLRRRHAAHAANGGLKHAVCDAATRTSTIATAAIRLALTNALPICAGLFSGGTGAFE